MDGIELKLFEVVVVQPLVEQSVQERFGRQHLAAAGGAMVDGDYFGFDFVRPVALHDDFTIALAVDLVVIDQIEFHNINPAGDFPLGIGNNFAMLGRNDGG